MKTLAELKQMTFIPHHECGCCGAMVGWRVYDGLPWFDSSCDCGCSPERPDTWENAFRWYNSAFEHESEEAIQAEWARSSTTESSSEEYHVKCEPEAIYAGTMTESGDFKQKSPVTDEAMVAVAQWLMMKRITMSFMMDGKRYRMVVAAEK